MKLKKARQKAIAKAKCLKFRESSVYIYRISPRNFEVTAGKMPDNLVQVIHTSFVKDGFYERNHPEYFNLPNKKNP